MNTHPEPEQLSAYIDGEMDADDQTALEQHLVGCSSCAATLRGLRATVADMRAMPAPSPSPQDSMALRAAINRARYRPAARYRRWTVAMGSAAAVAIGIVVLSATLRNQPSSTFGNTGTAAGPERSTTLVQLSGTNFTRDTALALLGVSAAAAGRTEDKAAAPQVTDGTPTVSSEFGALAPAPSAAAAYLGAIQRCAQAILSGSTATRTPIRYLVTTYEGTPAFILVYSVRSGSQVKTELWVVQRSDCYIRLFLPPR